MVLWNCDFVQFFCLLSFLSVIKCLSDRNNQNNHSAASNQCDSTSWITARLPVQRALCNCSNPANSLDCFNSLCSFHCVAFLGSVWHSAWWALFMIYSVWGGSELSAGSVGCRTGDAGRILGAGSWGRWGLPIPKWVFSPLESWGLSLIPSRRESEFICNPVCLWRIRHDKKISTFFCTRQVLLNLVLTEQSQWTIANASS